MWYYEWSDGTVLKIQDGGRCHTGFLVIMLVISELMDTMSTKRSGITDCVVPKQPTRPGCKPEVKFQCCDRLFSETGSSNISAVDRDISAKFGQLIDLDLLR